MPTDVGTLVFLLHKYCVPLKLVYDSEKDSKVNGAVGLSMMVWGLKWEQQKNLGVPMEQKRSIGHSEVSEAGQRLQMGGLIITELAHGGSKLVKLSPECRVVFEKLVEIAGRIE